MNDNNEMFITDDDQTITTGEKISQHEERSNHVETGEGKKVAPQGEIQKNKILTNLKTAGMKRKQEVEKTALQPTKKRKVMTREEILKLADQYNDTFNGKEPTALDGVFEIKVAPKKTVNSESTLQNKKKNQENEKKKEDALEKMMKSKPIAQKVLPDITRDVVEVNEEKEISNHEDDYQRDLDGYTFKIHLHLLPLEKDKFYNRFILPEFVIPQKALKATVDHMNTMNAIIRWINIRLVMREFAKEISGLYLWSYGKSFGKTLLCHVLTKIFNAYWWAFEDKHWQQHWKDDTKPELIIYNGVNSDCISFRQIECHGDEVDIQVAKRNKQQPSFIKANTPYIITSNKTMETLGYEERGLSTEVWKERLLSVCVDDKPLFPLIALLRRHFNIPVKKVYNYSWAFKSRYI